MNTPATHPPGRPMGETDLHAYVDGRLDAERREAVERYLAEHPEAATRIADWQLGSDFLRRALSWVAAEPVPAALSLAELARQRPPRRWTTAPVAAAAMVALCLGASAGWIAHSPGQDGPTGQDGVAELAAEAMSAHDVVSGRQGLPLQFSATDINALAGWASNRLGHGVTAPDLSTSGYHLLGGDIIATDHGAGCLYLYADATGQPLSVFMRPMKPGTGEVAARSMGMRDGHAYAWAHDGLGISIFAPDAGGSLEALSDRVRRAL